MFEYLPDDRRLFDDSDEFQFAPARTTLGVYVEHTPEQLRPAQSRRLAVLMRAIPRARATPLNMDMQTTAAWSSAICDCAKKSGSEAKTCAAALKKPNLDTIGSWWHGGGLKYSLESLKPYDEIMTIGQLCEATIPVGAR